MVDDRRKDGALATKARTITLQHYCDREKNVENKSAAELPAQIIPSPAVESAAAPTVCDFNRLKETTKNLDFEASRRMKRDESGDTSVHDNIGSRNAVKSRVFLLAILERRRSSLPRILYFISRVQKYLWRQQAAPDMEQATQGRFCGGGGQPPS